MEDSKSTKLGLALLRFLFESFSKSNIFLIGLFVLLGGMAGVYVAATSATQYRAYTTLYIGSLGAVGLKMPDASLFGGQESARVIEATRFYGLEPGRRLLIGPSELYRNLYSNYDFESARRNLLPPPYIENVDGQNSDGLRIYVRGNSEAQATRFLISVVEKLKIQHDLIFDESIEDLKKLSQLVSSLIKQAREEGTTGLAETLPVLINQKYEIDRALGPINSRKTTWTQPVTQKVPGKSPFRLGLVGILVGLFVGYLVSLMFSIFSRLRNNPQ